MNTVGKPGKLGERLRCVVSVSMLTEGWDANTVTHILGVRAFGTQLLCEQVVGRGLRRTSYAVNEAGLLEPEYAEVYGVPFSFIPTSGSGVDPRPPRLATRVRALEDRLACEITFPRVTGYRYDIVRTPSRLSPTIPPRPSTESIATITELRPIVGEESVHTLDDLRKHRENEVAFRLAKLTLQEYFAEDSGQSSVASGQIAPASGTSDGGQGSVAGDRQDSGGGRPWLFPQLLAIAKRWLAECLTCKDHTFPQLLLMAGSLTMRRCIYQSIAAGANRQPRPPIPAIRVGSTRFVDFDTIRPVWATSADSATCRMSPQAHGNGMAQVLEELPRWPATSEPQPRPRFPPSTATNTSTTPTSWRGGRQAGPGDLLNLLIRWRRAARQGREGGGAHALVARRQQPWRVRALAFVEIADV
jgi:type III restriction enzyme